MIVRILTFALVSLALIPASAGAQVFSNQQLLASPTTTGQADNPFLLYPSQIPVSGLEGAITDVDVTLNAVSSPGSFDYTRYLLVAPDGTGVRLWAGAGSTTTNVNLVIDQQAAATFPTTTTPLGSSGSTVRFKPTIGTYAPYTSPTFPSPAPTIADAAPDLNRLNGHPANGSWRLFASHAYSYMGYNSVSINGGWSIDIKTTGDITPPEILRPAVSGKTFGFDLSEAASLLFRVDQAKRGVKVKSSCLAPKKGRKGKSCTRYVPLPGAIGTAGTAGVNTFAWDGRLAGKKLGPGKYRLTGVAKDAAGNASAPATFTVTVKKPKKKKR